MKKCLIAILGILLILLSCIPVMAAEPRIVRIGAFDYYPAIFKDKDGVIKGFYVDALADIEQRENIRFDYVYGSWNDGLERIKSGEVDLLTSVAITPERKKFLDYARTPVQTVWGELYTSQTSDIDGIHDVQGKKIAVMQGDFNGRYFIDLVGKFAIPCVFVELSDFNSIFKAIAEKQVDAGVVNSTFGAAKQNEYALHSTGVVFNPFDIFFAAAKDENQDLLALLDSYLARWRHQADSPYNKSRQQWSHGSAGTTQIIPRWLFYSLATLGGVIIVALTFIALLKRQIRRATADILQSKAVLLESEAKFSSHIDHSPEGIFLTDEKGHYLEVNPAACAITGYPQEELLKMSIFDLILPESIENVHHQLQLLGEKGFSDSEYHFLHKSGNECWCSVDAVKLSPTRYLAFIRDITARRQTEEQLLEAIAASEAANTAKSQFLANMSHEIRTPMNGVIGLIELLLGTDLNEEQRKYAELIKLSGRNLVQLISDILDLSKIEAHKIELERRDFDLQSETTGTINLLALRAEEKGLILSARIDPDVPLLLKGDAGRLRQILTNIIGNAIKFTIKGSVSLHICKAAEDEERTTLRFLVRDSGIGIAADKLEKIFEPFTQADSSATRTHGGTGLGLTIARQLAELMGGTVGVESIEGEGATFWFTVVLEKQSVATPRPEVAPPSRDHLSPALTGSIRLLLAEDEPTNQLVTKLFLSRSGYLVDVANNGREALKLLEENDYALVLMDCMMPVLNGYEATSVIRNPASAVRNHTIPVIALTAQAMQEDQENCLTAGMNDYLTKPIEATKVFAMLEKWIPAGSAPGSEANVDTADSSGEDVIFDRTEFVSRSLGDLEISRYVAAIFLENAPEYIGAIRNALAAKDAVALHRAAHKLKGAAATMALPLLAETARMLDACAESGDLEKAAALSPLLTRRFDQALAVLREVLSVEEVAPQ